MEVVINQGGYFVDYRWEGTSGWKNKKNLSERERVHRIFCSDFKEFANCRLLEHV